MALTERRRIAHLLRRAGLGATPAELDAAVAQGFDAVVERLFDPASISDPAGDALDPVDPALTELYQLQQRWLQRMLVTTRPLPEKLALFWHDHFATSLRKVRSAPLMWRQLGTLRRHSLGTFETLSLAIAQDPAMLLWLDGAVSRRGNPNENFAREFLELFTLGEGNYQESDVRAAARAFTGYSLDARRREDLDNARFVFRGPWHDDGLKTFLGQTGRWDGADIVRIAVAQPACARHIAGKLFAYFAYEGAEPSVIAPFAGVFTSTGGDLAAVTRAILTSGDFLGERAQRARISSPVELAVGSLKTLEAPDVPEWTWHALRGMGQALFNPPNVGGWPSGVGWINHQSLVQRFAFAARLAYTDFAATTPSLFDADSRIADLRDRPEAVVDEFLTAFGHAQVSLPEHDALTAYLRVDTGPAARDHLGFAQDRLRGLAQLIMSMPAGQLT